MLLPNGKVIVSRNVLFNEEVFPCHKHSHDSVSNSTVHNSLHCINPPLISPPFPSNHHTPTKSQSNSISQPADISHNDSASTHTPSDQSSNSTHDTIHLVVQLPYVNEQHMLSDMPISQLPQNVHPIVTRSKAAANQPRAYNTIVLDTQEPDTYLEALSHPHWKAAMDTEYQTLMKNNTWTLATLPPGKKVLGCKWAFKLKRKADGSIARYKARLVAKGFNQLAGFDFS